MVEAKHVVVGLGLLTGLGLLMRRAKAEEIHIPPPPPVEGVIDVSVAEFGTLNPIADADVSLDGAIVGKTDSLGMISLTGLQYGDHIIEVSKYGYYSATQAFNVPAATSLTLAMKPILVDVTVTISE